MRGVGPDFLDPEQEVSWEGTPSTYNLEKALLFNAMRIALDAMGVITLPNTVDGAVLALKEYGGLRPQTPDAEKESTRRPLPACCRHGTKFSF